MEEWGEKEFFPAPMIRKAWRINCWELRVATGLFIISWNATHNLFSMMIAVSYIVTDSSSSVPVSSQVLKFQRDSEVILQ